MFDYHSEAGRAFSIGLITPALLSTLKQAEREAAPEMHALADAFRVRKGAAQRRPLTAAEAEALRRIGVVFVQQASNGAFFFTAARLAVRMGGVGGGVIAQAAITLNTMFHPRQTQRFNPSQLVTQLIGEGYDWTRVLSPAYQLELALSLGKATAGLGYGANPWFHPRTSAEPATA